ncbi:MAG: group 1 glycosyl transferase [Acidobacteria bacterium]|nr:MAG: group 1 glycosyl transferase [Acidobacteriota bacterium]
MRVLAWVPQELDTSPGQRFRIEQWAPLLRREQIELVWSPFLGEALGRALKTSGHVGAKAGGVLRALAARMREAWRAKEFDLVYIFREGALLGPALAERILRRAGVPWVFDFDDAVWVRYVSPANSYLSYLRFPGKTAFLVRHARQVMAGNAYLRDWAGRFNPSVSVVPTTIDTDTYRPVPPREGGPPVIGWTGSYSTEKYLELVRPALERLRRRRAFRLVVVGGGAFRADGVEVEHRPWRARTETADLADLDIGLMPLPDAEWERGKCGLKALQYMALGLPVVVSPVGVNAEIVRDGESGVLARTAEQWEEALERLLADADLRRRMGRAGRATVERAYSAAVVAPRVAEIFRRAAA